MVKKPEHEGGEPKDKGDEGKSLAEQNQDLKLKVENDKLRLDHEAYKAGFKTASEYQEALRQLFILQETNALNEAKNAQDRQEIVEQQEVQARERKALVKITKETAKAIRYAEVLKPLGEDRGEIVELLRELREKVTELVNLPEAFRSYNRYGIDKEFDRLHVEIKALIQTWLDTVTKCRENMVK